MNNSQKQTEQKPKVTNNVCCINCGVSRGTMRKIKTKDGTKGYLCKYCFDNAYREED